MTDALDRALTGAREALDRLNCDGIDSPGAAWWVGTLETRLRLLADAVEANEDKLRADMERAYGDGPSWSGHEEVNR